jgi:hypothetical protein
MIRNLIHKNSWVSGGYGEGDQGTLKELRRSSLEDEMMKGVLCNHTLMMSNGAF